MALIKTLPPIVRSRIAAGEVVENPASVVKELVENSLDAGAGRITVELSGGGTKRILVADDGAGIFPDDLPRAVEHFATSKIEKADDIFGIRTYGFRGEALASIAAVGFLTILSRRRELLEGAELKVLENGKTRIRPAACAPGTVVTVENLFYHLPARRKFLKTPRAETAKVSDVVLRLALVNPSVSFLLRSDGRVLLDVPASDPLERIRRLLGPETADSMVPFSADYPGVLTAEGFLGLPLLSRPNRTGVFVSAGRRPVWDATLIHTVVLGYEGLLPERRFPVVVLDIAFAPFQVDVNVHPQKREVRLSRAETVRNFLRREINAALTGKETPAPAPTGPTAASPGPAGASGAPPVPAVETGRFDLWHGAARLEIGGGREPAAVASGSRGASSGGAGAAAPPGPAPAEPPPGGVSPAPSAEDTPPPPPAEPASREPVFLGQLGKGYLLFDTGEALRVVDPHALHERLIYNRLLEEHGPEWSRRLLFPAVLSLPPETAPFKEAFLETLAGLGFDACEMGRREIAVNAVPEPLRGLDVSALLQEVLSDLRGDFGSGKDFARRARGKVLESLACRAAVKLGKKFSPEEALDLFRQAAEEKEVPTCPHGRPTSVDIPLRDIEKKLSRR